MSKLLGATIRERGGRWEVVDTEGNVRASCDTNAAAWRWIDRNEIHPLHLTSGGADKLNSWGLSPTPPASGGG